MKSNEELLAIARRAYERGRTAKALRTAALALPMALLSLDCCAKHEATLLLAALLAALSGALTFRGGAMGRGVVPGFVAGAVPLLVPLFACSACAAVGGPLAFAPCVVGGLASGAIIAHYAAREGEERGAFVVAAGTVAALAGSLGCVLVGLGGLVAMGAGLALATPIALRLAPR
jgi:hypothetical protein